MLFPILTYKTYLAGHIVGRPLGPLVVPRVLTEHGTEGQDDANSCLATVMVKSSTSKVVMVQLDVEIPLVIIT